jgi:hypothetical protein
MCLNCQAYDDFDAGLIEYDEAKEECALHLLRELLAGKKFTFLNMFTYVNTAHMRKEIMKFGHMKFSDGYCLALRRDSDAMLRLYRNI